MMPPTKQPRSSISAAVAECSHAFDSVGQWNALKKLSKWSAVAVSVKSNQIQMLFVCIYDTLYERNKTMEKLSLIYDNDIIG
jgi:hypothetical protein